MDVLRLHARALEGFGDCVRAVGDGQWHLPTPCAGWDVRDLVNHVVAENRWAPPLLAGRTIVEVGDALDGDLLGADPVAAWQDSADGVRSALTGPARPAATVHLSFGDTPAEEYLWQLFADLLVHGWDLARATGGDEALPADLVEACARWFDGQEDGYRGAGVIGPRVEVPDGADARTRLLARFGRSAADDDTLVVLRRFNEAFRRRDVEAVMALTTDDCVFEDTSPPDGRRHEGRRAVRAVWERLFAAGQPMFTTEEGMIVGDRAAYRWRYDWGGGHVRGVDLFRVRDGKVAEKLSYVKG